MLISLPQFTEKDIYLIDISQHYVHQITGLLGLLGDLPYQTATAGHKQQS